MNIKDVYKVSQNLLPAKSLLANTKPASDAVSVARAMTDILSVTLFQVYFRVEFYSNAGQCSVIITMGKRGALIYDGQQCAHIPAFSAVAVDTTGAGDAFNGALAAALAKGESLVKAAWYASAFASLAVEKEGAANMPDISLVDARIQQQNVAIQTF